MEEESAQTRYWKQRIHKANHPVGDSESRVEFWVIDEDQSSEPRPTRMGWALRIAPTWSRNDDRTSARIGWDRFPYWHGALDHRNSSFIPM